MHRLIGFSVSCILITVCINPVFAQSTSLSTSIVQSKSASEGAYISLKEQLARLSKSFHASHTGDSGLPDSRLFLAVGSGDVTSPTKQEAVRLQMAQLLTVPRWLYLWKAGEAHLLTRRAVTEEDRKAEHIKEGLERLHYLKDLAKDWPAQRDDLLNEDPDLACHLDAPFARAGIALMSSLPDDTIAHALGGETLQMPISSLSTEQKGYIQEYAGHAAGSVTDAQGHTRVTFDPKNINETGTLKLRPIMLGGSPDIIAWVYSDINDPLASEGGNILRIPNTPELEPRRQKAALLREGKSNALLTQITGVSTVTIDKSLPLSSDTEPPLAAYLRSFASQTGLTILGRWPDPQTQASDHAGQELARLYNRRLSASIVNRPLAEALNTLCTIYNAHWVLDDGVNVKPTVGVNDASLDGADPADAADPKKAHIIRFWADPPQAANGTRH